MFHSKESLVFFKLQEILISPNCISILGGDHKKKQEIAGKTKLTAV